MNDFCHYVFTCPGLTRYENGGIGLGDNRYESEKFFHPGALTDEPSNAVCRVDIVINLLKRPSVFNCL